MGKNLSPTRGYTTPVAQIEMTPPSPSWISTVAEGWEASKRTKEARIDGMTEIIKGYVDAAVVQAQNEVERMKLAAHIEHEKGINGCRTTIVETTVATINTLNDVTSKLEETVVTGLGTRTEEIEALSMPEAVKGILRDRSAKRTQVTLDGLDQLHGAMFDSVMRSGLSVGRPGGKGD